MRQGQQNRRGRGRNNNNNNQNRKGQNPLTRSFESTGPDVKIRGTPAHIAEKYMTLARDAQSSGRSGSRRELSAARRALQPHHHGLPRAADAARAAAIWRTAAAWGARVPAASAIRCRTTTRTTTATTWAATCTSSSRPSRAVMSHSRCSRGRTRASAFEDRGPRQGHDQHRQPHHRDRERHGGGEQRGISDRHDRPERQDRPERFQRPERVQRADPGLEGGGQQPARNRP